MRTAPISQICERPGESPVVSRSTTQYAASSSSRASAVPPASATQLPRHARRASATTTSSSSDRAIPSGRCCEREERASGVFDGDCAAPFLDELDEPVRRVEPKLHPSMVGERMFVCKRKRKAAPRAASF